MQQALRIDTTIDDAAVAAIPALRPLLGHRVEMIMLDIGPPPPQPAEPAKISFDEFLSHRLKRPEGISPVSLEDMQQAIMQGVVDGNL